MKKKDEVYSKFFEFKALVENESRHNIKSLRSNNGGEYLSNAFKELCAKKAIIRDLTEPHNPQKNGVTKRKNRSIVGVVRAMFHD